MNERCGSCDSALDARVSPGSGRSFPETKTPMLAALKKYEAGKDK